MWRIENSQHHNIADVIRFISHGYIQVPEFMYKFSWGEEEIINLLENFYSGTYRINVLLINSGFEPRNGSWIPTTIPSKRLSYNISKTKIKISDDKPHGKYESIYSIVDGYHRLQSLYLAWHGSFNGKKMYFNVAAFNETRFNFLKPTNRRSIHERLSRVKGIRVPDLPLIDQLNKNCKWFEKMFYESKRISFDIITIDDLINRYDPFLDQLFLANNNNLERKILADRIKFIIDNYISASMSP